MAAEKNFENKIKKYLEELGAWQIKYWAGSQFTKSGVPDLIVCLNGYFVAIEVKAQNGKPSELQLYNIDKIREAGGFAFVVYPSAWEELKEILNDLSKGYYNRSTPVILK